MRLRRGEVHSLPYLCWIHIARSIWFITTLRDSAVNLEGVIALLFYPGSHTSSGSSWSLCLHRLYLWWCHFPSRKVISRALPSKVYVPSITTSSETVIATEPSSRIRMLLCCQFPVSIAHNGVEWMSRYRLNAAATIYTKKHYDSEQDIVSFILFSLSRQSQAFWFIYERATNPVMPRADGWYYITPA